MCADENRGERYASFHAFVKNFFKCDSISTIRRAAAVGRQRTDAARRFVDSSASLPFAFTLTNDWFRQFYEEKGA